VLSSDVVPPRPRDRNKLHKTKLILGLPPVTGKGTQACSFPTMGKLKYSFFGLVQPKSEGHSVLSQLFD
jgi:hypothetical protein